MFFVGVEHGEKYSYVTILDQAIDLIEEVSLPSKPGPFEGKFRRLDPGREVLEVESHSPRSN